MENKQIADIVRERLSYDHTSGNIRWAIYGKGVAFGKLAGTIEKSGYIKIMINRRYYLAHRVAWLLHHGEWPVGIIDHIDGNPSNNKIINLRLSTPSLNAANKKTPATNSSGYKGVSWSKSNRKWYASIKNNGISRNLGYYDSPEKAHNAYLNAARHFFGEHARSS